MTGERRILETFVDGSGGAWRGIVTQVQARWVQVGLPSEPAEGDSGQAQLRLLASELSRLSIEVGSLIGLDPWLGEPIAFVTPPGEGESDLLRPTAIDFNSVRRADVQTWHEQIRRAIDALTDFLETDGGRD